MKTEEEKAGASLFLYALCSEKQYVLSFQLMQA